MKTPPPSRRHSGWTLIEFLIVCVIVASLATISFPMFGYLRSRAQYVACVSHLRMLGQGFHNYMLDNDMIWPQMPHDVFESSDDKKEWEWWYETLKPYGVSKSAWLCPADTVTTGQMHAEDSDYTSSYIPTLFDGLPNTAFKWSRQPWIIERGELHGKGDGPNVLMQDGTVQRGPSLWPK